MGFGKNVDAIDAREAAAAGAHTKPLTAAVIAKHLAEVGLDQEFTLHHRMRGLSGGQKVKVGALRPCVALLTFTYFVC